MEMDRTIKIKPKQIIIDVENLNYLKLIILDYHVKSNNYKRIYHTNMPLDRWDTSNCPYEQMGPDNEPYNRNNKINVLLLIIELIKNHM